jgi:hypothetical protein
VRGARPANPISDAACATCGPCSSPVEGSALAPAGLLELPEVRVGQGEQQFLDGRRFGAGLPARGAQHEDRIAVGAGAQQADAVEGILGRLLLAR